MTPDEAFERIDTALAPQLHAGGFTRRKAESHPKVFGSRYAEYESAATAVRLTWDGKDGHFVLECDRLPQETRPGPWLDLILMRFDARTDQALAWVITIEGEFVRALHGYLAQWRSG
jgi:hypothetical protein